MCSIVNVLLTAITTIGGLVPLAAGFNINFYTLFSDFNPNSLSGETSGKDSWRIPSYGLLSIHAGYTIRFENSQLRFKANIFNALNNYGNGTPLPCKIFTFVTKRKLMKFNIKLFGQGQLYNKRSVLVKRCYC